MCNPKRHGFKEPQTFIGPFASGASAIFIDQVAKLGADAGTVPAVGGQLNIGRLRADGVDISAIELLSDWPTGTACVRYRSVARATSSSTSPDRRQAKPA